LPIIGRAILERIEGRLDPVLQEKWKYESVGASANNKDKNGADYRWTGPVPLVVTDLGKPEDLWESAEMAAGRKDFIIQWACVEKKMIQAPNGWIDRKKRNSSNKGKKERVLGSQTFRPLAI
jgi:hypothetical protein